MTYIAEPIQRTELRSLAKVIRKILQVEDRLYIPVITVLENVMPLLFPNFSYEYVPKEEFPDKKHGETDIVNHIVRISLFYNRDKSRKPWYFKGFEDLSLFVLQKEQAQFSFKV